MAEDSRKTRLAIHADGAAGGRRRAALFGAAALAIAGWAAAAPAAAGPVFLDTASMNTTYTAHISGAPGGGLPALNENVYLNGMTFQASDTLGESPTTYDLFAFCVDIFHHITTGDLDAQYDTNTLTQNGHGDALSSGQIQQISGLVSYGTHLYRIGDPDLTAKLAGVQGAIWRVENPGYTFTSGDAAVSAYMNTYVALAPSLHGSIRTIYPVGDTQGFGYGVPEPGVWGLMIAGFGFMGAMLRRRRADVVAAPA